MSNSTRIFKFNLKPHLGKNGLAFSIYLFAFSFCLTPFFSSISLLLFSVTSLFHLKMKLPKSNDLLFLLSYAFIFLMYLAGIFFTDFQDRALELIIRTSPILFVPFFLLFTKAPTKINYYKLKLCFISGVFVSCLISIIYAVFRVLRDGDLQHILYFEFAGVLDLHPLYYSIYIITALVFLNKIVVKTFYKAFGYLVFGISLLLLQSKLGILILVFVLGHFVYKSVKRKHYTYLFVGLISLSFIFFSAFAFDGNRLNELFSSRERNELGTSREDGVTQRIWLWETAIKQLQENPLFGFGLGSKKDMFKWKVEKDILMNNYDWPTIRAMKLISTWNLHNNYLQICYEFGVLGLICFLASILACIRLARLRSKPLFLSVYTLILALLFVEVALNRQMGIYFYAFIPPLLFWEPKTRQ
ncbi:MAG: O-antigen ligase family protein [Allomuricauda sp.]